MANDKTKKPSAMLDKDPSPTEVSRDKRWGDVPVSVEQMRKLKKLIQKGILKVKK